MADHRLLSRLGDCHPCNGIPDRKILDKSSVFCFRWRVYDRDADSRLLRRLCMDPERTNYARYWRRIAGAGIPEYDYPGVP
ncbi:hypothetical protein D3C78_1523730 [compost metagenome]